MLVRVVVGLHC